MIYGLFVLINIIYIGLEFIFNFSLLNIVGSPDTTIEDIHKIEDIGRFLAASGFTLLLWKLIQSKGINDRWNRNVIIGLLITLGSFYGFYITQEKIIDYTARNFSPETTKNLYNLYLIKEGLLSGHLALQNIPYNEENSKTPESKTFLITLPLFMINNQKSLNYIEKNKEKISNHIYKNKIIYNPKKYIGIYQTPILKLDEVYEKYKVININRNKDIQQSYKIANESYPKMHSELKRKYRYSRSRLSYSKYVNTNEIKNLINRQIRNKYRIDITRDFNPMDKKSYSNAIVGSIIDNYEREYQSQLINNNYDVKVPLGLKSRIDFYNHIEVINFLKNKQGDFYIPFKNMGGDIFRLNNGTDRNHNIIIANSEKIAKALTKKNISADLKSEAVIDVIKSIIVPPIALILSIFFAFMNLFLVIKNIFSSIFKFFGDNYNIKSLILMYSLVFILLLFPVVLNNSFTETKSYKNLYSNMKEYSFFIAFSANWILKFEPFVYKYGEKIPINYK